MSIEVREEYRGNNYGKFMIDSVQNHVGKKMFSTGSFTEKGYKALKGYLPVLDDEEEIMNTKNTSFVKNWDILLK